MLLFLDVDSCWKMCFRTVLLITDCRNVHFKKFFFNHWKGKFAFPSAPLLPNPMYIQKNFIKVSWTSCWHELLSCLVVQVMSLLYFVWMSVFRCPYVLLWLMHRGFLGVLWQKWEIKLFFWEKLICSTGKRTSSYFISAFTGVAVEKGILTPIGSS